ncbi:MAG: aminoglycoside 6'-N-acetyltransferase [Gemmatimonadaceae bacterium]
MIRRATAADLPAWSALRAQLWPDETAGEHAVEAAQILTAGDTDALLAFDAADRLIGFVEVSLRSVAEGCTSSPVGFIEGWFVEASHRRQSVGSALVRAAEDWARSRGCTEMASDTEVKNVGSQTAHERLGYTKVAVLVAFRRSLELGAGEEE